MLAEMHHVDAERISALQSRIKDFQRREFPPGLNTGKGRAAEYKIEHIVLLTVAFEMLELGMTPDRICTLLASAGEAIVAEAVFYCRSGGGGLLRRKTSLIYFDPRGLSDLRSGRDFVKGAAGISIGTVADLTTKFKRHAIGASRLAVIDLGGLIHDAIESIRVTLGASIEDIVRELVAWGSAA